MPMTPDFITYNTAHWQAWTT